MKENAFSGVFLCGNLPPSQGDIQELKRILLALAAQSGDLEGPDFKVHFHLINEASGYAKAAIVSHSLVQNIRKGQSDKHSVPPVPGYNRNILSSSSPHGPHIRVTHKVRASRSFEIYLSDDPIALLLIGNSRPSNLPRYRAPASSATSPSNTWTTLEGRDEGRRAAHLRAHH